ncbi:hypothetical protein AGABI2DRAFT_191392 [Agaricus bisporus var. bisporus H97]|uniref:hypothetical protein n=1 Tax=Agaricus bisporus var. bisporus (strain H97 / ATCC MYA-4626 / FGSC 10389) TaxID=936046 RepID=UPI00029F7152|nr:hypothetical protein AGABI2DRAFT_191392 [Agaricus bisporus var. bisporus H97]EKV49329.1 hypothetical protein AGABI2DRAFT_191392 [Agaricus bisporus var. bisporus H97]
MSETTKAFFYGTLMHPEILKRVVGNDGTHLEICPAVLVEYTRHRVKLADYPGVVPLARSSYKLFNGREDLSQEDRCVRGTLVTGLTRHDIRLLDYFEGTEYTRDPVKVHPLGPFTSISAHATEFQSLVPATPPLLPDLSKIEPIDAETYVFIELEMLEPSTWDFRGFVERNAWKWYGKGANDNEDIAEVDRRRERGAKEMAGIIA